MSIKTKLEVEIDDEFDKLAGMQPGTDEHKATVDSIAKLMDRAIELEKLADAAEEKANDRKFENELKLKQAKDERLDRIVKNVISVAGIVLPIGLTIWGTVTSLEFEKENTVTTPVGRLFINKLFPKK